MILADLSWIRIRIRIIKTDPRGQIDTDPSRSGSTSLQYSMMLCKMIIQIRSRLNIYQKSPRVILSLFGRFFFIFKTYLCLYKFNEINMSNIHNIIRDLVIPVLKMSLYPLAKSACSRCLGQGHTQNFCKLGGGSILPPSGLFF